MPALSILLVNWNGADVLVPCLESIREQLALPYEVLLIDNASTDGSVEDASERFPEVKIIRSDKNLGFAAANNLGAQAATGEYLLLLNTDTLLLTDVTPAMELLKTEPKIGIVGAAMFSSDMKIRYSAAHFPSPARLLVLSNMKTDPTEEPVGAPQLQSFRTDRVEGSFLMIARDFYRELGGLNERLFMYGEDTFLCRTALEHGRLTAQCKVVQYIHHGGWESSRTPLLYAGYVAFHKRFSSYPVRLSAYAVLIGGLVARLAYYGFTSLLGRPKAKERLHGFIATVPRLRSAILHRARLQPEGTHNES